MLIDFHTHIFPEKIYERAVAALIDNAVRANGAAIHNEVPGNLDGLKESMRKNSVDYSVVMPIVTDVRQSESIFNYACAVNNDEVLFSFGSVHPEDPDWESWLEKIAEAGLLGIKLHPEYQQSYIDSPETVRIINKCYDLNLFVMVHAGEDIGYKPPYHCTPERFKSALDYFDGSNVIAAHMGGWKRWEEVLKYLSGTNIMMDTSYAVGMMPDSLAKDIIKAHGAEKFLFGSDSPWTDQAVAFENVKKLGLSKSEEELIAYKNAQRILKL